MNRHQRNTRFILITIAVSIGKQRHILQIILQEEFIKSTLFTAFVHKSRHTAQEFLQVLLTCQIIGILARHDILTDTTLLDNGITQFIDIRSLSPFDKRRNQQSEGFQFVHRTLVYSQSIPLRGTNYLPETHLVLMGTVSNLLHRSSTYSSCRIVDDTLDSLFIIRIRHQTKICNNILNFLALVETQSAINAIRNTLLSELLLEAAALGIGAIENGKITILASILAPDTLHVLRHNRRLFLVAVSRLILNLLTLRVLAEHILRNLVAVMLDQTVSRLNDSLGRTVVLFQFEETRTLKLALIVENIIDIGTTETIDTLRVITHGTNTLLLLTELHDDRHLNVIGILILIHQDIIEAGSIFVANILMFPEELIGKRQQIIEIHGIGLLAALHVSHENLTNLRHLRTLVLLEDSRIALISRSTHQVVLRHRNLGMNGSRFILLIIQPHLLHYRLDQRARVTFVINGKVVVEADILSLRSQDSGEDAVEGTHIEMLCEIISHQFPDTFLHLPCRLIGKGERHDAPGFHALAQEISYLISKYTRLTRTCTGYHQRRSVNIFYRSTLRFVQVVQ